MTILEHFRTQFSVPVPCFDFHLVSLMSQDLPVTVYSTNASRFQFVLGLLSLLINHDCLYLLELLILAIADL